MATQVSHYTVELQATSDGQTWQAIEPASVVQSDLTANEVGADAMGTWLGHLEPSERHDNLRVAVWRGDGSGDIRTVAAIADSGDAS